MSTRRSASVGALPLEKKHFVSRNESSSGVTLDVRCACQYFQCDSLLPERINPVDSRPTSKLDFHHDEQCPQFLPDDGGVMLDRNVHSPTIPFQPMSDRRLMAGDRITQPEPERLSMRSVGKHRSWDQASASVDISFVEKYPELEETARTRGLVVRSISDDDPHSMPGMQRQRFTSVDRLAKDPETLSMHSVRSLRRISRSPSKQDLYVADINIAPPRHPYGRREQRSVSGSRRSSNMDLSTFSPQINVITPTPLPQTSDKPPSFTRDFRSPSLQAMADRQRSYSRDFTPMRSMSPPGGFGYGKAKPPTTIDYMRPDDNKENMGYFAGDAEILPQNRPIDMSKYKTTGDGTTTVDQLIPQGAQPSTIDHTARELTPMVSSSPTEGVDFRNAKPPMSVDYMRPDASRDNLISYQSTGVILPQNRPIDMSKYKTSPDASTIVEPLNANLTATEKPMDPLQQTVAELEAIQSSRNLVDIRDNIQIERLSPPLVTEVPVEPLNLEEQIRIDINTEVKMVDIDKLVQEEEEKARSRAKSPTRYLDSLARQERQGRSRSASPSRYLSDNSNATNQQANNRGRSPGRQMGHLSMDNLQLPDTNYQQLKRGHSPERQSSLTRTKKSAPNINNMEDTSKTSYTTKFKSFFSAKPKDEMDEVMNVREKSPMREKSPSPAPPSRASKLSSMFSKEKSPMREKSPSPVPAANGSKFSSMFSKEKSPMREKSPSPAKPTSSKFMSMFSKEKPTPISVVSGTNAAVTNKSQAEPMSIKVVETFSLKVDEMDQYMAKPAKQKQPPPQQPPSLSKTPSVPKSFSSREDFSEPDRVSMNIGEAFVPVIIGRSAEGSSQFLADQRTSQSQLSSQDRGLEMRGWSKEPSIHHHPELHGKPLFSAAIMMDSSGSINRSSSIDRRMPVHGMRSPSEQRPLLPYKDQTGDFFDGRTQSTDRHRLGGSQDNISMARMTKTVSFNFDERKSRLSQFESATMPKSQAKQEMLERTYFSREHEYEPIGTPSTEEKSSDIKEVSPNEIQTTTSEVDTMKQAEDMQKDLEDRYFSSAQTQSQTTQKTPQMEIDVEAMETEDVPIDDDQLPKAEKKGFMATAQDKTRRMQAGFKNQAGKLKTKLKPAPKKIPSGSPKAKERKKFKAPEFSKLKMPEMKRPDMSKFRDFKRPEFTKFSKPDMSKFKLPEKMTNIKLRRSKSLKESDAAHVDEELEAEVTETGQKGTEAPATHKKLFEFNFGTYPRALRKKKTVEVESSFGTGTATEATSVIPSSETQPSLESSSTPQGDRGPGPVRSRWADKFSDVSYNDSEGSRYRRYGSEQESFDRESSLERRMREDLEDAVSEERNLGILGGVTDNKQFAEFDEENRAIHEISNLRSGEFRRRPITHQDSDVRSEDSKEAVGWTEKDIQKNTLLRKAEREAEASYLKYQSDDMGTQETQSTASSGKKAVLEEIGDDEFFLRKRGISQDNIEINQYIRNAFRDDYDKPINSLEHVGQTSAYGDYDVPPPKPRRLHKTFAPDNVSQDFDGQRSDYGDDLSMSHNGSDYFGAPRRPMRKGRSRSKYSMESQDVDSRKYMDEEYLRDPSPMLRDEHGAWNDLNMSEKENIPQQHDQPLPPRRQKRRRDTSMDKDSYINGFGGRSVSNSFLQPTEDVIVYRTEHEYHHVPLATPEKYSDNGSTRKSVSNYDLDERHSRGAISFEQNEDVQETEKFVIDMMENDGYAVVRKEAIPKPTPPARRKKFARSPGERFATMPNMRTKRSTPPPERPPPPRGYTPVSDVVMVSGRKSALSLDAQPNYEDDYEEPGVIERNLQSGEVINKMKYRPLPPPPRPPREKRQRSASKGSEALQDYRSYDSGDVVDGNFDKTDESDIHVEEVEACTQTDPLPDDFVCEEFEITDDMKVIEPRVRSTKTVEELLQEELEKELNVNHQVIDSEQLAKGLQRFRDANQRSLSERSRASSQADRSKSLSRPQTPSAILVERQSSTPIQKHNTEVVEASLVVRPIDDLELEEEELRREGLLTDSSQHSVSDTKEDYRNLAVSEASYAPSSTELDEALGVLTSDPETQQTDEEVERTLQRYRDELDAIGRELMETQTTSQEPSPSVSREEIKVSDREIEPSDREEEPRSDLDELLSDGEFRDESILSEIKEEEELTISEVEVPEAEPPQPPPRRKSTTAIEQSPPHPALEEPPVEVKQITSTESSVKKQEVFPTQEEPTPLPIPSPKAEQSVESSKDLAPMQTIVKAELPTEHQLPARLGDLEVERLRVHALQAGQIMVSQLHGQQISSDELECKSGNLVVQNIELPPGLIENIVEQVRQKERSQHLTTETQTSPQHSSEHLSSSPARDIVPPPKPPRLRDQIPQPTTTVPNADEQTQTDQTTPLDTATVTALPSTVFPTAEYLQSLAPLAFYNLHRAAAAAAEDTNLDVRPPQRHRRHHRRSEDEEKVHHRRRTRSTRTPSSDDSQSVTKAGSKFITACSLSLCKIINQLTDFIRGKEPKEGVEVEPTDIRNRQVPALVVLFIVITFFVLLYLMTGRSVHTHHWDYFNPPGQEGR
ncbi:uncharacterized protein LOC119600784 isoform X5 [Lucilia sericata]|uniref:uncharacterized protein LOC119600784 isoform X5 n=1 Tax=Lucilia sericata TaxID=13632 RepID=UPI0018A8414D|nr:uncharacterized protein LOC119600784 isoform X5 [Lucilia sericata]